MPIGKAQTIEMIWSFEPEPEPEPEPELTEPCDEEWCRGSGSSSGLRPGLGLGLDGDSEVIESIQLVALRERHWRYRDDRKCSASSDAMQPLPAAVMAWRHFLSWTSPAANTPVTEVWVVPGVVMT